MPRIYDTERCLLDLAYWEESERFEGPSFDKLEASVESQFPYKLLKVTSHKQLLMDPSGRTVAGLRWMPTSLRALIKERLPKFTDVFFTLCGYYHFKSEGSQAQLTGKDIESKKKQAQMAIRWFNDLVTLGFENTLNVQLLVDGKVIRGVRRARTAKQSNVDFVDKVKRRWIETGLAELKFAEIERGEVHLDLAFPSQSYRIEDTVFCPALFLSNAEVDKVGNNAAEWGWYSPEWGVCGPLTGPSTSQGDFLRAIQAVTYRAADSAISDWLQVDGFQRQMAELGALDGVPVVGKYDDIIKYWKASAYSGSYGLTSIDTAISSILRRNLTLPQTALDLYVEICKKAAELPWRSRKWKFKMLRQFCVNPERWV